MDDKEKEKKYLRNIMLVVFGLAIFVAGIYIGTNLTIHLGWIKIFFILIFILLSLYIVYITLKVSIPIVKNISDPEPVTDVFALFLLIQIRKNPEFFVKLILYLLFFFIVTGTIVSIYTYNVFPNLILSSVDSIRLYVIIFTISAIGLVFAIVMFMSSPITKMSKISIVLSSKVTDECIEQDPQGAIERAFRIFEDHLKEKLKKQGKLDEKRNPSGNELIKMAFGNRGHFFYKGLRTPDETFNFISNIYAKFRHPRAHGIIEDDSKTAVIIIKLVDVLIRIVDEAEERSPK